MGILSYNLIICSNFVDSHRKWTEASWGTSGLASFPEPFGEPFSQSCPM